MTEVFFSCEIPVYTFIKGFLSLTLYALYVFLTLFVCTCLLCAACRMVVHRMCMVEGILGCEIWQKKKAGGESGLQ